MISRREHRSRGQNPVQLVIVYQEKVIKAGLRASGRRKCEVATVAMGRMATKSVMRHWTGTKGATARMIMPTMKRMEKSIENLNC